MTATPALWAASTLQCGCGWVSGTPGASTKAAMLDQSELRKSATGMPAAFAFANPRSSSSKAMTEAPPEISAWALASPEPPRPNTATVRPANVVTGITTKQSRRTGETSKSSQLQGRQADEREHDRDDPETDDDLRLGPTQLLEMMVDGRHLENAFAGELERNHLHDHRNRLEHEQPADNREHDLVLGRHRNRADHAAERERAGVAHENRRWRRVEPQKTQSGPEHRPAQHRKFAGAGDIVNLQIIGEYRVAGEVCDHAEARGRDHHRHDGKPVEAVGQIYRVAGADDNERREQDEEPAEINYQLLEERKHQRRRKRQVTELDQHDAGCAGDQRLDRQARAAGEAAMGLLFDFQIIVVEADETEPDRDPKHHPDVGVGRVGPQQRRHQHA